MHVPDGWFKYSRYGTPIGETRIIAVKTPLKQAFNNGRSRGKVLPQHLDERGRVPTEEEFTPTQLVEQLKRDGWNLRAVIDLTFTSRYYNPKELEDLGVQYSKVFCPGREIPNDEVYLDFATSLSKYLESCRENSDLVAVHCTHGLNRTGYLVCRYLIDKQQFSAEDAIQAFNRARGYDIERENYLQHLRAGCPPLPPPQNPPRQFQRKGDQEQQQYHHRNTPHSSRGSRYYDQYRPPAPPHHQFQRGAWRQDWQDGQSADQSTETRGHDRKKKHHRGKRRSSREPQLSSGPVPLFSEHNGQCPSAQGPTPIPLFPGRDPIPPSYDQGGDYHGQNSSERSERANSKHRRRDKGRHKRKQRPYESSASLPSRTGSGSSEKDPGSFTNDASQRPSYESDCMEPEGLSSGSPWARAHSRGRGRWEGEGGHLSMMEVDQSSGHDWSHQSWSHDPWEDGADDGGSYYDASHLRSDPYHWRPK